MERVVRGTIIISPALAQKAALRRSRERRRRCSWRWAQRQAWIRTACEPDRRALHFLAMHPVSKKPNPWLRALPKLWAARRATSELAGSGQPSARQDGQGSASSPTELPSQQHR